MTVVVAFTGYLREVLVANRFGVGAEADAFYLTLALVQTVHDLLFAGALTSTVIPLLQKIRGDESAATDRLVRTIATMTVLVAVAAVAYAAALRAAMPNILRLAAPEMTGEGLHLSLLFADVLVWAIPANALMTLFVLILNAHHHFRLAALSFLINNLAFIGLLYQFGAYWGAIILPVAVLAGPLINIGIMGLRLHRIGLLRVARPDFSHALLSSLWHYARPLVLSMGLGSTIGFLMVSQLIARSYAAGHGGGAISALGYAFRLYEVPIALVAGPAATMLFPVVAALHVAGNKEKIADLTSAVLMWGLVVLFPAVIVIAAGADSIVQIILQRGKFDMQAAQLTAEALRSFAPAVLAESAFVVFFRVCYAMNKSNWTVGTAAISIAVLIAMLQATRDLPFSFVPLSVSCAFTVAAGCVVVFLIRRLGFSAVPHYTNLVRWAGAATVSVIAWRAIDTISAVGETSKILSLAEFCLFYFVSTLFFLSSCRRELFGVARRLMWHTPQA